MSNKEILAECPFCFCGQPAIHVHHIAPRNSFPQYEDFKKFPWNAFPVCKDCHDLIHGKGRGQNNIIHPEMIDYEVRVENIQNYTGTRVTVINRGVTPNETYYAYKTAIMRNILRVANAKEVLKVDTRSYKGFRSITAVYPIPGSRAMVVIRDFRKNKNAGFFPINDGLGSDWDAKWREMTEI